MWYEVEMNNESFPDLSLRSLFDFKPSKGDLKRLEIIKAAIESLATVGFDKTTYESIAKIVGTRRAHINYYFQDKNDIFMSCIKYIIVNYQQVSLKHIEEAKDGKDMVLRFVEGPYIWAQENPKELIVMYLFYYLCSFNEEYKDLHGKIRIGGAKRLAYILEEKLDVPKEISFELSKTIQNSISGYMLDATTTTEESIEEAKIKNIEFANFLLEKYAQSKINL